LLIKNLMRERKRNSIQITTNKDDDTLRNIVEQEYATLYRQQHKAAQNKARQILQQVTQPPPPRSIEQLIPSCSNETESDHAVSVVLTDGTNKNSQTASTIPIVMPTLPIIKELISYVPTTRNLATRGHLIGIPYLGDKFDAEDQRLINSISSEPSNQQKLIRKKKLDEQSLEIVYQTIRSNPVYANFSNENIVDEIIHYHRDSSPRMKLLAFANHTDYSLIEKQRLLTNIDQYDTVDADIDELIIKPWCSRFCPRCYTYNCLLHKEGPSYLPLPKQLSISTTDQSEPCSSTCYKHQREPRKRSRSPSDSPSDQAKRQRKSSSRTISNENFGQSSSSNADTPKRHTNHCLTRIENHFLVSTNSDETNLFTLTERTLFRLFYFLADGDLCYLTHFFPHRTCQDFYQQFIIDSKYFSEHLSSTSKSPFLVRQPYRRRMPDGSTRAFLLYMKKNLNRSQKNTNPKKPSSPTKLKPAYQPCLHDGPCTAENSECYCIRMGTFCEKFCNCSIDCPRRFPGCACKGSCTFNSCLCSAEGRECDPDLCHNCGASLFFDQINPSIKLESEECQRKEKILPSASIRNVRSRTMPTRAQTFRSCRSNELSLYKQNRRANSRASLTLNQSTNSPTITCANISLQRQLHKQILVAESDVAGYGAFLGSPIAYPGDLIAEYTGEIISEEEADRRGRLYDKRACSYLFNLDMQHCIDARQFGNKLRFANHSSKANCVPKIKLVNGDYRIGIFAKEIIFQGDELFFEYMYDPHQRQQFVNNERIDENEQENLRILIRYEENFMLVQPVVD